MIIIDVLELLGNVWNMIWHGVFVFACENREDMIFSPKRARLT